MVREKEAPVAIEEPNDEELAEAKKADMVVK